MKEVKRFAVLDTGAIIDLGTYGTKGYEWARRRLRALQARPIGDTKEESEEDFGKRLASRMKGIQWRYSPQGIEKVVFDEFVPEKDER